MYQRIRELEHALQRWESEVPPGSLRSDHLYNEQMAELKELQMLLKKSKKKSNGWHIIQLCKFILFITVLYLTIKEMTNQYFEFKENEVRREVFLENAQKYEHYQRLLVEENAIKYCVIRRSENLFKYNIKDMDDEQLQKKMRQIEEICEKQYKTMY